MVGYKINREEDQLDPIALRAKQEKIMEDREYEELKQKQNDLVNAGSKYRF